MKADELGSGYEASVWVFLAMSHWQRGEKHEARSWYDRAIVWMEKNRPKDEELNRCRDEAAALLGLVDKPKSSGKKEENPAKRSTP